MILYIKQQNCVIKMTKKELHAEISLAWSKIVEMGIDADVVTGKELTSPREALWATYYRQLSYNEIPF